MERDVAVERGVTDRRDEARARAETWRTAGRDGRAGPGATAEQGGRERRQGDVTRDVTRKPGVRPGRAFSRTPMRWPSDDGGPAACTSDLHEKRTCPAPRPHTPPPSPRRLHQRRTAAASSRPRRRRPGRSARAGAGPACGWRGRGLCGYGKRKPWRPPHARKRPRPPTLLQSYAGAISARCKGSLLVSLESRARPCLAPHAYRCYAAAPSRRQPAGRPCRSG